MRWLNSRQNPDGSFINLLSTMYVIPALIGALPYDLQDIRCPKNTTGKPQCALLAVSKRRKEWNEKRVFLVSSQPLLSRPSPFSPFISPFVSPSCRTLPKRPADHTLAKPYRNGFFTGKGCGLLSSDFCSTVFSNNNNHHAIFIIFQEMLTIIKLNLKAQGFCFFLGLSALQSIPSLVTLTNSCYMTPYLSITYLII